MSRSKVGLALSLAMAAAVAASVALANPYAVKLKVGGEAVRITAKPLDGFGRAGGGNGKFGRLEWRGGLELSSPSGAFGGWSGLTADFDGARFLAVSDAGNWMTFEAEEEDGRLTGIRAVKMGPLVKQDGKRVVRRRDVDAESVRLAGGSLAKGQVYVSYERNHRIGVADVSGKGISPAKRFVPLPESFRRAARNEGLEGIAVLANGPLKGSLVAFAEHLLDGRGRHSGWIWARDKTQPLSLSNPGDFSVTDAAGLQDGGLLVLERRFNWLEGVRMRLRHVAAEDIKPGAALTGEILLEANQGLNIDNMEGLAVHEDGSGDAAITLISDDNFNPSMQRTLLLRFLWRRERLAEADGEKVSPERR